MIGDINAHDPREQSSQKRHRQCTKRKPQISM